MTLFGLEMFPNLVFSNPNPENSLTAYNAASSHKTLGVMLTIALIAVPSLRAECSARPVLRTGANDS